MEKIILQFNNSKKWKNILQFKIPKIRKIIFTIQ